MDATASNVEAAQQLVGIARKLVQRTVRKIKLDVSGKHETSLVEKHVVDRVLSKRVKLNAHYYQWSQDRIHTLQNEPEQIKKKSGTPEN